jgi:hypothetical protein
MPNEEIEEAETSAWEVECEIDWGISTGGSVSSVTREDEAMGWDAEGISEPMEAKAAKDVTVPERKRLWGGVAVEGEAAW